MRSLLARITVLALAGLVLSSSAAVGAVALTSTAPNAERAFAGLSEVKTVRDVQLPTL